MPTSGGAFFQVDPFGFTAIALSLFSNTAATLLVGYKAWRVSNQSQAYYQRLIPIPSHRKHGRTTKRHFARVRGAIRVQHALMLLVESGIVYWLLWVTYFLINYVTVV